MSESGITPEGKREALRLSKASDCPEQTGQIIFQILRGLDESEARELRLEKVLSEMMRAVKRVYISWDKLDDLTLKNILESAEQMLKGKS